MADAADCCGVCFLCCTCFAICGRGCLFFPCCRNRKHNEDDEEFAASVEREGRLHEMDLFTNAQPVHHSSPMAAEGAQGNDASQQDPSRSSQTQYPDRIAAHEERHAHLRDTTYPNEGPQGNIVQAEQRHGRPSSDPPIQPSKPRIVSNTPTVVAE